GLAPESCRQFRINPICRTYPSSERRSGCFVKPVEWHGGHCSVVAQSVDELAKGMMLRELLRADSTDEEDRCRPSGTDNETNQLDGLGITPLQIVDDQQTWTVGDDDRSAHNIEQPLALSQVAGLVPSRWLGSIEEFGQETSKLVPPDCVERVDVAPESIRS